MDERKKGRKKVGKSLEVNIKYISVYISRMKSAVGPTTNLLEKKAHY